MPSNFSCERCGKTFTVNRVRNDRPVPRWCNKRCRAIGGWDNTRGRRDPHERFWEKVRKTPNHWLWTSGCDTGGYGQFNIGGRLTHAHRLAYIWSIGPIPDGFDVDHLCHTPRCVNPSHLEPVPPRINSLRGFSIPAVNARKTHCVHGHPFNEANTYTSADGRRRQCRVCRREIDRIRAERKRQHR